MPIEYDTRPMPPAVTVAVVSWNTRDLLDRCLKALLADADRGVVEVTVVDNASTDGSPDLVRESHPWVTLLEPGENLGFGPAVNLAADRSQAEWIAPANADVAPSPGAIDRLLVAGRADPQAGAVAPRLVLPDGSTQHSVYGFPTLPHTAAFGLGLHHIVPGLGDRLLYEGFWDADRPRVVGWAVGAFGLVRRTAWDQIGGFDDGQWMYAEDLDLGWRLDRAGWHTRYVPEAHVLHEHGAAAVQAFGDQATRRWMDATYEWMLRRRGPARTRAYAAIHYAAAGSRAAMLRPCRNRRLRERRFIYKQWAQLHRAALMRRDW
jgi:GT2 family glycosyltransferase